MIFQTGLGIDVWKHGIAVASVRASLIKMTPGGGGVHFYPEETTLEEKTAQTTEVVRGFIRKNKLDAPEIFVSIPRESLIVREITFPDAVKDNLETTLLYELEKYIPFSPDDVYFDHIISGEISETRQIRVMLVAARKKDVDAVAALSDRIGIKLSGIGFRSCVLGPFLYERSAVPVGQPYALLLNEAHGFELAAYRGASLFYTKLFKGKPEKEKIRQAISELRNLMVAPEEVLHLAAIPEGDFTAVLAEFNDFPDILRFEPFPAENRELPSETIPAQSLAYHAIRPGRKTINLLPHELRRRPSKVPHFIFITLCILVFLGGISWGGAIFFRRQSDLRLLDEKIQTIKPEAEAVRDSERSLSAVSRKMDDLNGLLQDRILSINLLKELTNILPLDAYVVSMSYHKGEIRIEGIAEKATELIPLIESSALFSETKLQSAITREKSGKERFLIGFKVTNANLQPDKK